MEVEETVSRAIPTMMVQELLWDATENFLPSVGVNFALCCKRWKSGLISAGMADTAFTFTTG